MSTFLAPVPTADDEALHRRNADPELISRRLRELVPMLAFIDARVEAVGAGHAVVTAPLCHTAMNQNGTQQAAVFYLLADYAVGIAMFGALPGIYVKGVHDRCDALPVQMWLKRCTVEHVAPGSGMVRATATLTPDQIGGLRRALAAKGRAEVAGHVEIVQGDGVVATADAVVVAYADLPPQTGARLTQLQAQNLKTSALLIAGLRGDPLSQRIAEEQGRAIAARMTIASPQLPTLIAARTAHLVDYLGDPGRAHAQVLVLGVGLDSKPVRFASTAQRWFVIDHPEMLAERARRLRAAAVTTAHEVAVPADLRDPRWAAALTAAGFRPELSTLVIAEGISMYLSAEELDRLVATAARLCAHAGSRLWLDHVTEALLALELPEVTAFLATMSRLGEPFVLGFDRPERRTAGWRTVAATSAAAVYGARDPIHAEYRFALLAPSGA